MSSDRWLDDYNRLYEGFSDFNPRNIIMYSLGLFFTKHSHQMITEKRSSHKDKPAGKPTSMFFKTAFN